MEMKTTSNQRKIVKKVVVSCAIMALVPFKEIYNDILSIMVHDYTMLPMPIYTPPAGCPYDGMRFYNASEHECAPCTGTCEEPNPICPLVCRSGCACPHGTVLHEGECIPEEECPKKGERQ